VSCTQHRVRLLSNKDDLVSAPEYGRLEVEPRLVRPRPW